jgi:hypothetical protein
MEGCAGWLTKPEFSLAGDYRSGRSAFGGNWYVGVVIYFGVDHTPLIPPETLTQWNRFSGPACGL